jgi:restriction system protein
MTIIEAIKETMRLQGKPLTISEAYHGILESGLYTFNAEKPLHIVASQIRRHCVGLDFPSASETKHFTIEGDGRYWYIEEPVRRKPTQRVTQTPTKGLLRELKEVHRRYDLQVRDSILANLKGIHPSTFENFAKKVLDAYGFVDVKVTQYAKDGGIDGHGRLKIGLAYMNVAFQCKRFNATTVGRPEIDRFRGAIQGQYEQGVFFTTTKFAPGAEAASFRAGAVPIVLIDGKGLVDLMIEKQLGVEVERMPVLSYALDLLLSEDNQR